MSYFLCTNSLEGASTGVLRDSEAHHAAHVRRVRVGEVIEVQDSAFQRFSCRVTEIQKHEVCFEVEQPLPTPAEPSTPLTLCLALTASTALDLIVQKSTELGVHDIVLYPGERSPHSAHLEKAERWQKIALEAAKQSGRSKPAQVTTASSFTETLRLSAARRYYASQHAPSLLQLQTTDHTESVALWIGPEGGFSDSERAAFAQAGILPALLPGYILRSETAAIAGVSLLQAQLLSQAYT